MTETPWKPEHILKLVIVATLCLCVMSVVVVLLVAVMMGKIAPDQLGTVSKAGAAAGFLGLVYLLTTPLKGLLK